MSPQDKEYPASVVWKVQHGQSLRDTKPDSMHLNWGLPAPKGGHAVPNASGAVTEGLPATLAKVVLGLLTF